MLLWGSFYIAIGGLILLIGIFCETFSKNLCIGKTISTIIVFGLIFLLASFKATSVGRDTQAYLTAYESLANSEWNVVDYGSFEISFSLLMKIFGKMQIPFQGFVSFLYFIVFTLTGFAAHKLSENPSIVGFAFFTLILPFGLSAQRQILSASIFSISLIFISKSGTKNIILYTLFVFLASLFHITTLSALILLLIKKINIKKESIIWMSFILVSLFLVSTPIYQVYVYNFSPSSYYPTTAGRGLLFWTMFALFILLYLLFFTNTYNCLASKIIKKDIAVIARETVKNDELFLIVYYYSVVFLCFIPVSDVFPRFYFTYIFSLCLLFSRFYKKLSTKKAKYIYLVLVFTVCSILLFLNQLEGTD